MMRTSALRTSALRTNALRISALQRALCPAVSLALFAIACGDDVAVSRNQPDAFVQPSSASSPVQQLTGAAKSAKPSVDPVNTDIPQKLIRTGELRIQVKDVQKSARIADSLIQKFGGRVSRSQFYERPREGREVRLELRVPSAQFNDAVTAYSQLGDMQSRNVGTEDITKAYTDLETRLAVKEQTLTRLRGMLDSRTAKLSDVLDVEREIERVVEEVESMKGERRFYDQQLAMSSLAVTLFEDSPGATVQFTAPIAETLHRAMGLLGTSLSALLFTVIAVTPWLVLAWILWRVYRRVRPRKATKTA